MKGRVTETVLGQVLMMADYINEGEKIYQIQPRGEIGIAEKE